MFKKLEHIGIMVNDIDRSLQFYTEILGMKLVDRQRLNDEVELAFLAYSNSEEVQIELISRGSEGRSDEGKVHHVAFTVDHIEDALRFLKEAGVKLKDESPRTILNGVKIAFFFGPDGERLELVQPK